MLLLAIFKRITKKAIYSLHFVEMQFWAPYITDDFRRHININTVKDMNSNAAKRWGRIAEVGNDYSGKNSSFWIECTFKKPSATPKNKHGKNLFISWATQTIQQNLLQPHKKKHCITHAHKYTQVKWLCSIFIYCLIISVRCRMNLAFSFLIAVGARYKVQTTCISSISGADVHRPARLSCIRRLCWIFKTRTGDKECNIYNNTFFLLAHSNIYNTLVDELCLETWYNHSYIHSSF